MDNAVTIIAISATSVLPLGCAVPLTGVIVLLTFALIVIEFRPEITQLFSSFNKNPKQLEKNTNQANEKKQPPQKVNSADGSQIIPSSKPPKKLEPVGNNKQLSNPTLNQTTNTGVELGKVNNKERDN